MEQVLVGTTVKGLGLDPESRCTHWHSPLDVLAIRFKCCETYYACFDCHQALADHPAVVWPKEEFETLALLCGACGHEFSITQYLGLEPSTCLSCGHQFNPGCRLHRHLYFEHSV